MASSFDFLANTWPDLHLLAVTAQLQLPEDPCACALKLRLLARRVCCHVALREKVPAAPDSSALPEALESRRLLPGRIGEIVYTLDRAGSGISRGMAVPREKGEILLRLAFHLCVWLHRVYGDETFTEPEFTGSADPLIPEDFDAQIQTRDAAIAALAEPAFDGKLTEALSKRQRRAGEAEQDLRLAEGETALLAGHQIRLEISALAVVNYALQQNRVPILHKVILRNRSGKPMEHLQLEVSASPPICVPVTRHIDYVAPDSAFEIRDLKLTLDPEYLAGLTEKVSGFLRFCLYKDGAALAAEETEITALSFDEWHGYRYHPELLAAFVTPNHPQITEINLAAAEYLGQWTRDPSLDAYQTKDPNRCLSQAAAIYTALLSRQIVYAVPPASFERVGQRVRLCDTVLGQRMGTCLDLTLLYAACLEAAGLHPLLILQKGHIFAGLWLEDLSFPEAVQDDAALITKRMSSGIHEIAVVECTAFTSGRQMTFDQAREAARRELAGENPVEYIIDVNRARLSGVSPLPLRVHTETGWHIRQEQPRETPESAAPGSVEQIPDLPSGDPETLLPKQIQWERKLLDLGLRNQLINMRLTKNILPILTDSLEDLENALASGSDFSIFPRPLDWQLPEDQIDFEMMHNPDSHREVIRSEFKSRRLRSVYPEGRVASTLKDLYRNSRTALEENGANTLYLALGILRWYESPKSTKARYAPVVLLPVDMVRRSAAQGYVIRLRDDEAHMNITMLEKMKQDFGITVSGLDPLPQDEHGIDIRRVFAILRKAVMSQSKWDVLESAYLGIFSFSQFVMWNDMRNRTDDLARNKIVRSLMDGKLAWDAGEMQIGSRVPEDQVLLPLSADASQLFAIEAACQGKSFVLHGPPGTGKSQTITALIANALAQNRTVLFVAEKMAALEVVQKRLENIGIGPFCLELHSNKSKKRDVLDQLRRATEVTKHVSPASYAVRAEQIAGLRSELDAYAAALHQPRGSGMSLYDMISGYESVADAPEIEAFSPEFVSGLTEADLDARKQVVERLIAAARAVGHPEGHPLEAVGATRYSQRLRSELRPGVEDYAAALERLAAASAAFAEIAGEAPASDRASLERLAAISRELTVWLDLPREWASQENINFYLNQLQQMIRHYLDAEQSKAQLLTCWHTGFLTENAAALEAEWNSVNGKWFLPKALGLNSLQKRLSPLMCGPVAKEALGEHFRMLSRYQQEKAAGDALFSRFGGSLDRWVEESGINWQTVLGKTELARESAGRLRDLCDGDEIRVRCGGIRKHAGIIGELNGAWVGLAQPEARLNELLSLRDFGGESWISRQLTLCEQILAHGDGLKEWITWNALAEEALALGLAPLVDAYRAGMPHEDAMGAYLRAIYMALTMLTIDEEPALNHFSGALFNEKIQQFKRIDRELTDLTRQEIYCRLASRVPNFTQEAAQSSEVGILQRAIRSGGRGISIRKLFEQIPNLLPRLCPCMLMSPISAAQYLDPRREPFSLVVFDEASQLPTCKAVGALARGKEAVIVGDPKQMPPTTFFATNTVDEENLDTEDLESILDDCLAMNIPQTHLLWHYRSRHESLIAFSNSQFYDNKLYTFPSVNDRESKVTLVHVDGVFERGKNRQNRAEAQAVVEEIRRRFADPVLRKLSIGVVTFNISQQNLIDDLMTEACAGDPELEKWAFESEEPIFIKNLENVQGDERDVILFSVGYGPDEKGKVYMNFGPLNRDGGWRRLNVAVSRSRQEMVVFSTLTPEQIDLSRTSAQGVAALKAFLEYAGGKDLPQDEHTVSAGKQPVSGIADTVCRKLAEAGYQTDRSVGHSEYRIDIAVVDPEQPERYLLGILLDGSGYGSAKTARDREIAQISVLNGLGWNILRVWSMDWWDNSGKELQRILSELERLRLPREAEDNTPDDPESQTPQLSGETPPDAPIADAIPAAPKAPAYQAAVLKSSIVSAEDFLLPKYNAAIRAKINAVIEKEAPITEALLTRRILQSYGISRSGSRIQSRMDAIYRTMNLTFTHSDDQKIFWRKDQDPECYPGYRCGGEGSNKREAKDVPMPEVMNAVRYVLYSQIGLPEDVLIREAARLLGYSRTGTVVVPIVMRALHLLQEARKVTRDLGGNWILSPSGEQEAAEDFR